MVWGVRIALLYATQSIYFNRRRIQQRDIFLSGCITQGLVMCVVKQKYYMYWL
jgi:hypothetical protein